MPRLQSTNRSSNNAQSDPSQQQQQLNEVPQQVNDGTPSEQPNVGTLMTGQQLPQPHIGQREEDGPTQINPITQSEHLRRSKRVSRPPQWLIEVMKAEIAEQTIPGELFSLATMFPVDDTMDQPHSAFYCYKAADSDPDTMYHHQAMQQPDREQFRKAMQKEMDDQMADGNFELVQRDKIPIGTKIFPAAWQMRRKRDIKTQEVKKWKARLNFDGSQMRRGEHYNQSYAPVASWGSIRLALAIATANNWASTQVDYVMAFPQAPSERDVYMEIPRGYDLGKGKSKMDYALLLHGNVYGQKQAARVWYKYLESRLVQRAGFTKSKVDDCIFYKGNVMYVLYTDDSVLFGPTQKEIDNCIQDIQAAGLKITLEGDIKDFLGVNIEQKSDGTTTFSQPHLIDKVLKALCLNDAKTTTKDTPAPSSKLLSRHTKSKAFDKSFQYRSVIGMLNYLDAGSHSDIAYATHQCARFAADPKVEHGKAV